MKSAVKICFSFFLIAICTSHHRCYGKSLYVEYEADDVENDPTTVRNEGANSDAENSSERNLISTDSLASGTSGGAETPTTLKISRRAMNNVRIGNTPWILTTIADDDGSLTDELRMPSMFSNSGQLQRKPTLRYGRRIIPYNKKLRSFSSNQRNFFGGGLKKRQSISYRQCFFNPIACFKK